MNDYILEKLIDEDEIKAKILEIANKISIDFKDSTKLLFVGVLKGAWIFLADIVRAIELPLEISFIAVSSYKNKTETNGVVRLLWDIDIPLAKRDVFLVEDIIDTGLTLKHLKELLSVRKPNSINLCCLLDKPSRRLVDIEPDYKGFSIPDHFVVGYGLDYAGKHRNLKNIYKIVFKS
jgi:hypoxanthine phosphoribosyltransferase